MTLHGIEDEESGIKYIALDEYILYLVHCEDVARENINSYNTIAAEVYRDLRKALIKYRDSVQEKEV